MAILLTGDLAGVTFAQNVTRRRIAYAKTYPKRTPSPAQLAHRAKWPLAVATWKQLTPTQKQTLDTIATNKKMVMSGYNLWISCYMNQHLEWIAEFAADYGLTW
jgi:hypothetical protein